MNLNDFLASNVDAIDWRRAAFGDVIRYLDPDQRDNLTPWAWVIDGVPSYDHRANLIAWTKRIDDQAIPQMRSTPVQREFSPTMFQVWRRFPDLVPSISEGVMVEDAS